jgi:flagellar biosynthesis GTPase FlhF
MTQALRMKTYFSSTVEAAIALARRELGAEAMLMNSRAAPADAQHLGRYEVVFAASAEAPEEFHHELQASEPQAGELQAGGVAPHLVDELMGEPSATLALRMESMIRTSAVLGETVALIGPPGRGKTSTLLKLAVKHGLALRRPVRILSADNRRFGSFAATLGVEFRCFETIQELDGVLGRASGALTFIDTSRYDAGRDLARCLAAHAVDTHLVLRADAPAAGLLRMTARYGIFEAARLIFTGLDEVETFGHLFSVAVQTKQPVSFLCAGQRIPEDVEPATARRMVDLALNRARALERAA